MDVTILRFMVEVCWGPMLAAFSMTLDQSDDKLATTQCLQGFRYDVHVTAVLGMQTQRDALVTSLAKFSYLHCAADMKQKNVDAIKSGRISSMDFHRASSYLVTASNDESIRLYDVANATEALTRKDSEEHILSNHAVSEVLQRDTSRKIIEMIIRAGWTSSVNRVRIERILKVHNPQTKVAQFEEYREMVKIRDNRLTHTKKQRQRHLQLCLAHLLLTFSLSDPKLPNVKQLTDNIEMICDALRSSNVVEVQIQYEMTQKMSIWPRFTERPWT